MAKTITFNYKDKEYTLEYTRRTIEMMEKQGFDIYEAEKKPLTTMHQMFRGAFKCHHQQVPDSTIEEIYNQIDDMGNVYSILVEMYKESVESLGSKDDSVGKIKWEVK